MLQSFLDQRFPILPTHISLGYDPTFEAWAGQPLPGKAWWRRHGSGPWEVPSHNTPAGYSSLWTVVPT